MSSRLRTRFSGGPRAAVFPPWLLAVAIVCGGAAVGTAGPETSKLVVVVYPHESDVAPGIVLVNRAIRTTFANQGQIEVRNEYVNSTRLGDADFMQAQVALLQRKYAGRKVDLVIAGLSAGLDFALAVRDDVFPGVPIVHVLVDQREAESRRLPPDVVGVPIRMDLTGTLEVALRLQPDTRRVFVITGSSPFDRKWEAEARQAFRRYGERVEFVYLAGLPMDELLGRVADLPERSIIYYLHVFKDGAGKDWVPAEALEHLAARANAPTYTHVDTFVDRGAVGGHVYSHENEGRIAAQLGLRILSGEKPTAVPVAEAGENIYMFNWRQLRRWKIDEESLPAESVVRFKEPTLWDDYRWHIVGVLSLCALEALLIAGLLVQRVKRRRSEAALRASEAQFRHLADAAPNLIWVAGLDKKCTYFNRPWLEFSGRLLEHELGGGWAAGVHPEDLERCLDVYTTRFDAREPFEMVYRLRRHDGEYRWVLDQGVPRITSDGKFAGYIGACTDVTDRRRTEDELRVSQRELRSLAGRLIEAQEAERRRIARELHDDLSQGLALLAVELDLVAQRPPTSTAEMVEGLRGFSARVRDLATDVHELSHQLHPSKIEHLGLVASIRGLCHELGQHHGLTVTFAHRDVPEAVSENLALCIYRIAQEGLHNVIKHAQADRARVELTGLPGGLRLQVRDDGDGFDPAARGGGLGLVGMRERLSLVGGQLVIDSRPAGGTRIEARIPLPEPVAEGGDPSAGRPAEAVLVMAGSTSEESP